MDTLFITLILALSTCTFVVLYHWKQALKGWKEAMELCQESIDLLNKMNETLLEAKRLISQDKAE